MNNDGVHKMINKAKLRMGLVAHLEGPMNGTFLIALGAIWTEVRLPPLTKSTTVLSRTLRHICELAVHHTRCGFRHSGVNPTIAAGYKGQPWQESLIGAGFLSVAVAIIIASILVLWGLRTGISLHESQQR